MNKLLSIYKNLSEWPKQVFHNMNWLFWEQLIKMWVWLVLWVLITRYLWPQDYGTFSFAIAFVTLFSFMVSLWLDNIVIRELVNFPDKRDKILWSVFLMKLLGWVIALLFAILIIYYLKPWDSKTFILVLILSISWIFQSINVIDYYFQSKVDNKKVVIPRLIAFTIISLLKIYFLVTWITVLILWLITLLEWIIFSIWLALSYKINRLKISDWRVDYSIMKELIITSRPLAISGMAIGIYSKIDQVMIWKLLWDKEVWIYSVAVQMTEVFNFIPMIIASTLFPAIIASKKMWEQIYNKRIWNYYNLIAITAYLIIIPVFLLSDKIILFLLWNEFYESAWVLRIYVWSIIPVFMGVASSSYLVTENFIKISFYRTLVWMITNIILNILLIPKYWIIWASIATIISYSFAIYLLVFINKTKYNWYILIRETLQITNIRILYLTLKKKIIWR